MNNRYEVKDILAAVEEILNKSSKKSYKKNKSINEKPLELKNEIKNQRQTLENIPKDTEKIILEAEKFIIKKN